VAALSKTSTETQTIFIEEGTYEEQVYIPSLAGELIIYGETEELVPSYNLEEIRNIKMLII
jgi:pectinesterase